MSVEDFDLTYLIVFISQFYFIGKILILDVLINLKNQIMKKSTSVLICLFIIPAYLIGQIARKTNQVILHYASEYTGKVLSVDAAAKQMVLNIDGKEIKIKYPADSKTPTVGQMIKFTERKQANARPWIYGSCEECNGECPGVCFMTSESNCRCYLFHL